jgi:thiol-disulfide isomerase/thioredoxin
MRRTRWPVRLLVACIATFGSGVSACSIPGRAADPGDGMVLPSSVLHAPLDDTTGRPLVIADELARGKTVALVFWQAWCAPCRAEAPALVTASRAYPDLEIVGVVSGPDDAVDAEELERAIRELGLPYRNVRDRALDLTRVLEVRGTPTIVVLDSRGQVLYRGHEVPDWETLL